jgi:magnesium transporter
VDAAGRLVGVVVLRDLFLAPQDQSLAEIMIRPPFFLRPEMTLIEAMKAVVSRHYPVYPVCDSEQRLIGLVRGHVLFEKQAYIISAQVGTLVGLQAKERLSTSFWHSFRLRHPWLQINLVMSLFATVIMSLFKGTIEKLVILAIFAPLVTAQARNSSAQTMAIVLRAISTGEWMDGSTWRVFLRETLMALLNGVLVGAVAGSLMAWQGQGGPASPLNLAAVMVMAMAISCSVSAMLAVLVPQILRYFGADPALAGGIILSTFSGTLAALVFFWFGSKWAL